MKNEYLSQRGFISSCAHDERKTKKKLMMITLKSNGNVAGYTKEDVSINLLSRARLGQYYILYINSLRIYNF